ncbi:unnamed protein product (macronuclear) [Paramecium tetraurelia]|uniref:Uncharacterized protein n=1 Tax=Paramecium tetraurelia TaxID=5888 RepID=A0BPD6_PARTE|nr:uncharacterized protein GSPATT00005152001 [Paramecium tetraurelia]CAK60403.1 unnamed protein product [Paramecium tetraurelia]|eukprot:XP_001427801.1 hypothetical protein (macronuclear) [Paramecium tetraurelia strain d4-2]
MWQMKKTYKFNFKQYYRQTMLTQKFISDSPAKKRDENDEQDYIFEQLEQINKRIYNYQQLIKQKINILLGNNTMKSIDYDSLQKQLSDLRLEEQNYSSMQFDIDRQQSSVFDYYESEFNKLKSLYETINKEHQGFIKQKQNANELYCQMIETKQILQEDLNTHLLQRAELVGQKEELEEFVEQVKNQNEQLFMISQMYFLNGKKYQENQNQVATQEKEIKVLQQQREEKQKQLGLQHQATLLEVQLHQANQKIKIQRNKIIPLHKSLNLSHPDNLFQEFQQQNDITSIDQSDFNTKLAQYLQSLRNNLFKNSNQGTNWGSMKEFITQLEQFIIVSMQQKLIQTQLSEMKLSLRHHGEELQIQNKIQEIDSQMEMKRLVIKQLEEQQEQFKINDAQDQFQSMVEQSALEAYDMYKTLNKEQLQQMKEHEDYDRMLLSIQEEIIQIISEKENVIEQLQFQQQFINVMKLIEKFETSEQAINTNIFMVDQQILPQFKQVVQQLSKLKREIEHLNQNEKHYLERTSKIEQEIQYMEQEFKKKMDQFQRQENELNNKIYEIKQSIQMVQDQLINKIKPNKAQLEQEILQMNNQLSQLQEQKYNLEQITYNLNLDGLNKSPSGKSILSISKSLNQLAKVKLNITPIKQMKQSTTSKTNSSLKSIK